MMFCSHFANKTSHKRAITYQPSSTTSLILRAHASSAARTVVKLQKTPVVGFNNKRVQIVPKEVEEEIAKPLDTKNWTKSYFEAPVINFQKQIVSSLHLDPDVFGERIRPDIIHRVLVHRLKQKENDKGIKPTKRSVDVHGSTRKVYSQKGRGAARHSTKRAPQFRGGGKSHGRKVRDLRLDTPSKVLKFGFRSALSAKYAEGKIIIIDQLTFDKFSSVGLKVTLEKKGWPVFQMLFLDYPSIDPKFFNSSRRVADLLVMKAYQCNIWDILRREYIVLTPQAIAEITRIYKP